MKVGDIESHLHHIKPPIPVSIVVVSVIWIYVFLLQIDAALAEFFSEVAVCPTHVDEADCGEKNRDREHHVDYDCT